MTCGRRQLLRTGRRLCRYLFFEPFYSLKKRSTRIRWGKKSQSIWLGSPVSNKFSELYSLMLGWSCWTWLAQGRQRLSIKSWGLGFSLGSCYLLYKSSARYQVTLVVQLWEKKVQFLSSWGPVEWTGEKAFTAPSAFEHQFNYIMPLREGLHNFILWTGHTEILEVGQQEDWDIWEADWLQGLYYCAASCANLFWRKGIAWDKNIQ